MFRDQQHTSKHDTELLLENFDQVSVRLAKLTSCTPALPNPYTRKLAYMSYATDDLHACNVVIAGKKV